MQHDRTRSTLCSNRLIMIMVISLLLMQLFVMTTSVDSERVGRVSEGLALKFLDGNEDIITGKVTDSLNPGQRRYYHVRISNLGENPVTVDLSFAGTEQGWELIFDNSKNTSRTTINSQGYVEVLVIVTAPFEVGSTHDQLIRVIAIPEGTTDEYYGDITITVLEPSFELLTGSLTASVEFQKTVEFILNISNKLDMNDNLEFDVEGAIVVSTSAKSDVWTYMITPSILSVNALENGTAVLTVRTPTDREYASNQAKVIFTLEIESTGTGYRSQYMVKAEISQEFALMISSTPAISTINPGETTNFTVTIRNNGSNSEHVSLLVITSPSGWNIFFEPLSFEVGAKSNTTFTTRIKTNPAASAGLHSVNCQVLGTVIDEKFALEVTILQHYGLGLNLTENGHLVKRGAENNVTVLLDNNGNGKDTVRLRLYRVPSAWNVGFKAFMIGDSTSPGATVITTFFQPLVLEANTKYVSNDMTLPQDLNITIPGLQRLTITVFLLPSIQSPAGGYNLTLYATGSGDQVDTLRIPLQLQASDLSFASVQWSPSSPHDGDTVTVRTVITNDFGTNAEDFEVILSIDNEVVDSYIVGNLAPRASTTVNLKYSAKEGEHLLMLRIEGMIISPEHPVTESHPLTVKAAKKDIPAMNMTSIIIAIGVVVLLLVLVRFVGREH